MKFAITFALLMIFSGVSTAQTEPKDSLTSERNYNCSFDNKNRNDFAFKRLILPVALITTGSVAINRLDNGKANKFNQPAKYLFYEKLSGNHIHIDDVIQYAPALAYLSIGGKEKFTDRLLKTATAGIICWGLTAPLKEIAGETRPDLSADNSFPSGHTATAFFGAELIRLSGHSIAITIPAYLTATAVGCLRIHNNRHWFCDVVAGAGFGILSARVAHWLLPLEKRLFSGKEKGKTKIAQICY